MTEPGRSARALWRGSTPLRIAIIVALALLLLGFVSVVWTPYPAGAIDVTAAMQAPSGAHWLGTDQLGRDVLSLLMKGLLTSVVVAAVAVAIGGLVGVPLGLAAATLGPYADLGAGGISAYLAALPAFVLAVLLACLAGPSAATLMVALGVANIAPLLVATRAIVAGTAARDHVAAARLAGAGGLDLVRRHSLGTILRAVLVAAVAQLAAGMLGEAALSYVGLGTQPPATSLGLLLRDAQSYASMQPALLLAPGLVLFVAVLALNGIARALRASAAEAGRGAA